MTGHWNYQHRARRQILIQSPEESAAFGANSEDTSVWVESRDAGSSGGPDTEHMTAGCRGHFALSSVSVDGRKICIRSRSKYCGETEEVNPSQRTCFRKHAGQRHSSQHLNKEHARKSFLHGHPYPRVVARGTRNKNDKTRRNTKSGLLECTTCEPKRSTSLHQGDRVLRQLRNRTLTQERDAVTKLTTAAATSTVLLPRGL